MEDTCESPRTDGHTSQHESDHSGMQERMLLVSIWKGGSVPDQPSRSLPICSSTAKVQRQMQIHASKCQSPILVCRCGCLESQTSFRPSPLNPTSSGCLAARVDM